MWRKGSRRAYKPGVMEERVNVVKRRLRTLKWHFLTQPAINLRTIGDLPGFVAGFSPF